MNFTMTKIAAAAVLALAATGAQAVSVATGGVFNMYSQDGLDTSQVVGNGEVAINVDTAITGFVDQAAGTWGVSSTNIFFGLNWTASGGTLITTAGNYALNTTTGAVTSATGPVAADGTMYFTVGANQAAGAINFAWGATTGIRVVNVWDVNANGSLTAAAVPGMENGPFLGFNAAFNFNSPIICSLEGCDYVPPTDPEITPSIPEASTYAMMLAGLGLVGAMARRRKQAEI